MTSPSIPIFANQSPINPSPQPSSHFVKLKSLLSAALCLVPIAGIAQRGGDHAGHRLAGIDEVAGGDGGALRDEGEERREVEDAGEVGGMTNEVGFGAGGGWELLGTRPKSRVIPIFSEVR